MADSLLYTEDGPRTRHSRVAQRYVSDLDQIPRMADQLLAYLQAVGRPDLPEAFEVTGVGGEPHLLDDLGVSANSVPS